MKLEKIIKDLNLRIISAGSDDIEIINGNIGDLLSEVMRTAKPDSVWITYQTHQNIIAVAEVVGIKAIIIPYGLHYSEDTAEKACEHGIYLLESDESAFAVSGKLYGLIS
ncbi:MAG TPA: iron-sulfur binding hydrogenase [Petrotogaceae bacterium]|jgi:hypothetical protein|nr:iron-sulfur binding hydrogenase [Petrotogaceae bacterium]HNV06808.1 iron-sulfur binding hydrogenase [Petrotogaceae bacterium]HPA92480.1 iron-sulfur binding hydrogenase [Petrotogaceae bacterium]HPG48271.1 iron-sulfur binding hydrogenase [Petrotogaceae bacterium]HPO25866.1 iron-sulfur binding hydrogenase [Petrotogaceae bacterium]